MPVFLEASVAQLVEHHLAKVNVEGSNPFARSTFFEGFQTHPLLATSWQQAFPSRSLISDLTPPSPAGLLPTCRSLLLGAGLPSFFPKKVRAAR